MNHKEVEQRVMEKIKLLVYSFGDQFLASGITCDVQLKSNDEESIDNYDSEIEIVFNKHGSFLDIIEFFIYRNGKLYIEEEKIIKDLYTDIEEVIFSNL